MDGTESGDARAQTEPADLPVRRVTINSLVALNMAYFRKAAGLTQEELGERIGWGKTIVSTAERSWDAKRVRQFSADDLVRIAMALGVPLAALFLPPEDNGTAVRYLLDIPSSQPQELDTLLSYVLPRDDGDTPVMDAFRKRLIAAGASGRAGFIESRAQQILDEVRRRAEKRWPAVPEGATPDETEALRRAEQITAMARARAEALERDALERHRQAMDSLPQRREELERRIDDLQAFEREYRVRLRHYLEVQFRDLLAPEPGTQTDLIIEALRQEAAERGASRVSAVILREDGTYQQVQFAPPADDGSEDET